MAEDVIYKSEGPVQEGLNDAVKETAKDTEKHQQVFEKMVENSEQAVYTISNVFPFVLKPDHITVDLNKVTIIENYFFKSQRIHSIFIPDITDVYVDTTWFFAQITIVDKGFKENEIKVNFLPIARARTMRRIIQGLIVAKKQAIDLTKLEGVPNLIEKLEKLGEAHSPH